MTTQIAKQNAITKETVHSNRLSVGEWIERIVLALVFVGVGGVIMFVLKPWGKQFFIHDLDNYIWRIGASIILLIVTWLVHRSQRLSRYWQLCFAMSILSIALSLSWVFGSFMLDSLHLSDSTPIGWAYQKVNDCLVIVAVVITFTLLSGSSLGSIYIQKGKLKLGLIIGGITFILALAGSIPMADLLFNGGGLTVARVLPWMPLIILIVLANGALEELLFRGLFLRKLEPFFGKFFSNFLVALVFTVLHKGSSYTSDQYIFLAATALVALAWGYIMQKTEGVWGSILFHAGMDIPIFLGIFANI